MRPDEIVVQKLSPYLGEAGARSTLNTFCKQKVGVKPEALTAAQMPLVLNALKSFLSVMLGAQKTDEVLAALQKEFT